MHPDLKKLTELQEIDGQILKLQGELDRYPQMRQTRRQELERAVDQLKAVREEVRQLELRVRETESQVKQWRTDLERLTVQQSKVKNQKEYDALTHETEELQGKIAQADEKGAEFLLEEDELENRIAELEKSAEVKRHACEEEMKRIAEREAEKTSLLQRFQERRGQVAATVDATVLKRYSRLLELHPDSAVVPVRDGQCGGCFMSLTRRRIQALKEHDELCECDSCHRFLYLQEKDEEEN